ncbi:prepilin-type N-terminal cleavage/methylation domain-containing protein [Oceaniglobus trochenteri]|uniref:prepilin-type N-terminal cleavage/methylation domain-containing protein n=1 Tax=Oceaniglobus trochenteri TaxID=2763260 RepID=UPI001CFFED0B|nr:prepilin-type N-terminal cleavage/methylation domain-containing protein [Oceaniglobus trochenteri]
MTGARRPAGRAPEAGVTLVEMLVALALFAMIGLVGFGMLSTILRAQERTEGRMERLGQIDGALRLLSGDMETGAPGTLTFQDDRLAIVVAGRRHAWRIDDTTLTRALARPGESDAQDQALLPDVSGWGWRFLPEGGQWGPAWPPADAPDGPAPALRAAEVELRLRLGEGDAAPVTLRRLFVPLAVVTPGGDAS